MRHAHDSSRFSVGELITWCRLPLGASLALLTLNGDSTTAVIALGVFVGSDYLDGSTARRSGDDHARRRALDSVVDRLSIAMFLVVSAMNSPGFTAIALAFLVINVISLPLALVNAARGYVLIAPKWHRCWTGLFAIVGACYLADLQVAALIAGFFALLALTLCSIELERAHIVVLRLEPRLPSRGTTLVTVRRNAAPSPAA